MIKDLEMRIEELRMLLNNMVKESEEFDKEEILKVSRKLDEFILEYMKLKAKVNNQ